MTALWLQLFAGGMAAVALSLYLTYGSPLTTEFWKARYRRVGPQDHVGWVLELVFPLLLWLVVLFLALVVFPRQGAAPAGGGAGLWIALAVASLLTLTTCVYASPREHRALIRGEAAALERLPQPIRGNVEGYLRALAADTSRDPRRECRRTNRLYWVYGVYSLHNGLLFALMVVLVARGLAAAWSEWQAATAALEASPLPDAAAAFGAALLASGERFLAAYWQYETALLALAESLLAVVAAYLLLAAWALGTSFRLVFVGFVVAIIRALAVAALVALVAATIYFYADLSSVTHDALARMAKIAAAVETSSAPHELLHDLNDLHGNIRSWVNEDVFWSRLANSYGGILLLVTILFSLLRKRKPFLNAVVPRWARPATNPYLAAIFRPDEVPVDGGEGLSEPAETTA